MFTTTTHGPIFNGEAERAAADYVDAAQTAVAEEGVNLVQARLANVLQHPTGYYQSQIHVASSGQYPAVSDSGVIYGPWLEGVGSRNAKTRFKGYATFRKVRDDLQRRAQSIAEPLLRQYLGRMG